MLSKPVQILVLDDDPALLAVLEVSLGMRDDCRVTAVSKADAALAALKTQPVDLFVTDYALDDPSHNGLDMLRASRTLPAPPKVIIITAFATLEITIEAIKLGCFDFLTKPFQIEELQLVVRNAISQIRLEAENAELRGQILGLAANISDLSDQQRALIEKLRQLEETYGGAKNEIPEAAQTLNGPAALGIQRRQAQERLSGYARIADSLLDQVQHKQSQIQILFQSGCLAEDDYKRLMAGRSVR